MSQLTKCAVCGLVRQKHESEPEKCWSWDFRKGDLCYGKLEDYEPTPDPEPWIDSLEDEN